MSRCATGSRRAEAADPSTSTARRPRVFDSVACWCVAFLVVAACGLVTPAQSLVTFPEWQLPNLDSPRSLRTADLDIPAPDRSYPISISAREAVRWQDGPDQVWVLRGNCRLRQGDVEAVCGEAVVWSRPALLGTQTHYVTCYLESDVVIALASHSGSSATTVGPAARVTGRRRLERWQSHHEPQFDVASVTGDPVAKPELWQRAQRYRAEQLSPATAPSVAPAQFAEPIGTPVANPPLGPRVIIESRGASARTLTLPGSRSGESVIVLDGGVRAQIIDEATGDVVQVSADRVVGWSSAGSGGPGSALPGGGSAPREIYLEGNVDYRHGETIVQAERMYYNVTGKYGVVLRAEFLTPLSRIPQVGSFQGYARLKADVLQQIDADRFVAHGASFTTSRMGVPGYWLQAEQIALTQVLDNRQGSAIAPDPFATSATATNAVVNSRSNFLYLAGVPVFYWPSFSTDLNRPTYYLESIGFNSDNVFGFQFATTWDLYQLFGFQNAPLNTDWNLSIDYLSKRGIGAGTDFTYSRAPIGRLPGAASGYWDLWGISDTGLDNLGADRREVPLEADLRGRLFGRHRHIFEPGFWLDAEVGWISDRNFLEQYFEGEWDELKDQTTGLELRRLNEERSWSLSTNLRVNDFFTETEWLPRLDHFTVGRSLLGDYFTWFEHSHVGYGRLQVAEAPTNPVDIAKFQLMEWETPNQGIRAATRQEVDLPLSLGPFKIVPYALGELAYWQEDVEGQDASRAYGQLGVRSSLPLWRLDRDVQSVLFNLNGLAHKVVFHSDAFLADANRDFEQFPLYDPLDDNSAELFRRRMPFDTFSGTLDGRIPDRFDERFFALRRGMQSWVTSPTTEIADDLMAVRAGVRQRWQTKRGRLGEERIIDWITLDVEATYFPEPDRDNFGEAVGLVDYDLRWHVGDRVTLVSDGYADFFPDGLKMFTVGGFLTRPGQSQLYGGFRNIDGPFQSHLLTGAARYRLSDKWILDYASAFDLGPTGNIGQSAFITRVGESFLATVGFTVDSSRGNVGLRFAVEPRILAGRSRYGGVGGIPVPPVGVEGLQ